MVDTTSTTDSKRSVSDLSEAGAPGEIEVTPAMIEAGVAALYESCVIENPLRAADRSAVRRIFLAMMAV
jgi:hypothetical protein